MKGKMSYIEILFLTLCILCSWAVGQEMARILLYWVSSLKFLILVDMYSQMFASFDCVGDTTALSRCMSQGSSATHGAQRRGICRGWRVE